MEKIEFKDYTKILKKKMVLDHIDRVFDGGKTYAFTGPNGSGKTMMLRAVSGLILPTSGCVVIDGREIGKDISFPENIGAEFLNTEFFGDLTGKDNLLYLAAIRKRIDEAQIREVMNDFGLDPDDERKYEQYSQGMKQKLNLIQAFMEGPDILLLDEPSDSLDEKAKELLYRNIDKEKKKGTTIFIATHELKEIEEIADEEVKIYEGRIDD